MFLLLSVAAVTEWGVLGWFLRDLCRSLLGIKEEARQR